MHAFSEELRQLRESRQITLEAMSGSTKVSVQHLRELEAGEFGALPGGVFRRGILRAYLGVLGVDPAPWMQRFEACLIAAGQAEPPAVDLEQVAEGAQRSRPEPAATEGMRWPGVFAMLGLLLVFGWCVWHFALRGHLLVSRVGARPGHVRVHVSFGG